MTLLLIHTGGTIGMGPGPDGLVPVDGKLESAIKLRLPQGVPLLAEVFTPLLDSADVGPPHWNRIIATILANPGADVIVTHGTDTMAFTGAALAQALAGSGRRVILCGAMVPLDMGGDGEANLDLALAAARTAAPGVWLAFAGQLMPAGGLAKIDSHAAEAFTALPQPPAPIRNAPRFADRKLAILTMSPGLPATALDAMLGAVDGAVLRVFGAGTAMSDPAIRAVLHAATRRGCRIRAVSQCLQGGLTPGAYAAGECLWSAGVENGGTETPEAALIRLWLDLSAL